jgi:hypothetical protein
VNSSGTYPGAPPSTHGTFDEVFRSEGIRVVKTPVRAPKAHAIAERFVRTVRSECLDWLLILNRRHLEHVVRVYTGHYKRQRPQRALTRNETPSHRNHRLSRARSRRLPARATSLDIPDKRTTTSKSETSVTVKRHPGPSFRRESLAEPTSSKEARMTYSAVHNLSRHVT